ncbi:hypothetical protein DYI95_008620 [Thermaerobacter sp. PB12/4term]|uniref:STM3941 family protein n=1 Tax=Thermaerobacter sp. PB12/4term TaxID=2293838 RepID=UPI000E327D63|nr:STM3941 family protein [Thermaerobacter sp. PB12/4term]QIA27572.1 hypothetical protein DYI95_008620 [Thermaerobacter sp. PB12/4term]
MNPTPQVVTVRTPTAKAVATLVCGLLMTAVTGFVLLQPVPLVVKVVGWVGIVFFGTCTILALRAVLWPNPVLLLDGEGVEIRHSAFGRVRIPWDDVDHLVIGKVFGQRMLGIVPKDIEAWLATHAPAARVLLEANLAYGAPYWVAESTLPGTCEDVARMMQRYRPVAVIQR